MFLKKNSYEKSIERTHSLQKSSYSSFLKRTTKISSPMELSIHKIPKNRRTEIGETIYRGKVCISFAMDTLEVQWVVIPKENFMSGTHLSENHLTERIENPSKNSCYTREISLQDIVSTTISNSNENFCERKEAANSTIYLVAKAFFGEKNVFQSIKKYSLCFQEDQNLAEALLAKRARDYEQENSEALRKYNMNNRL